MNIKKPLVIAGIASSVALAGFTGVSAVSATTNHASESPSLVDKIATTFDLNRNEVQKVVDDDRKLHEAEHQQYLEKRLDQAVADGKITAAQKDKILAKAAEKAAIIWGPICARSSVD